MAMNMSDAPMWDERYSTEEYVFGTDPAAFLTQHEELFVPGSETLVVADGEGRNSVYLATRGMQVTAMDVSEVGVEKARRLAIDRGATVDFRLADITTWKWAPDAYDMVVAVFIQFLDPEQRAVAFDGMQRTLRTGGRLLLHGYSVDQLAFGTGGPSDPAHLYTDTLLAEAFATMEIEELRSYEAVISEGAGHSGRSALVDLVATKR